MPEQYGFLKCLESLNISNNELEAIPPPSFFLVRFLLGNNKLKELPDMDGLEYLKELYISHNQISNIPEFICRLPSLNKLLAANCRLTDVPTEITNLNDLEILDLSYNQLTSLPSIGNLKALRVVDVNHNKISTLDGESDEMYELQCIDISSNNFTKLPSMFEQLVERGVELLYHSNPLSADLLKDQYQLNKFTKTLDVAETVGTRPSMEDQFLFCPAFAGQKV